MTLSPVNADLWAACCPTKTAYGVGAQKTWTSKGVQYPCTPAAFETDGVAARSEGWSTGQMIGVFAALIILFVATAVLFHFLRRRWGANVRIYWDYMRTLLELRYQRYNTGARREGQDVEASMPRSDNVRAAKQDVQEAGYVIVSETLAGAHKKPAAKAAEPAAQCSAWGDTPAASASRSATMGLFRDLELSVEAHRADYVATHSREFPQKRMGGGMLTPLSCSERELAYCETDLCHYNA